MTLGRSQAVKLATIQNALPRGSAPSFKRLQLERIQSGAFTGAMSHYIRGTHNEKRKQERPVSTSIGQTEVKTMSDRYSHNFDVTERANDRPLEYYILEAYGLFLDLKRIGYDGMIITITTADTDSEKLLADTIFLDVDIFPPSVNRIDRDYVNGNENSAVISYDISLPHDEKKLHSLIMNMEGILKSHSHQSEVDL